MNPGILVRESVVILPPHVRRQQIIQRRDRLPPRNLARRLQPLRVLVEHRIDDVNEGLVAREKSMPPGQQIAFQPSLAHVLAQHFHHPAVDGQILVHRQASPPSHVFPVTSKTRLQPVRSRLVGPEHAEILRLQVAASSRRAEYFPSTRVASPSGAGLFNLHRKVAKLRQSSAAPAATRHSRADSFPCAAGPSAQARQAPARSVPFASNNSSGL